MINYDLSIDSVNQTGSNNIVSIKKNIPQEIKQQTEYFQCSNNLNDDKSAQTSNIQSLKNQFENGKYDAESSYEACVYSKYVELNFKSKESNDANSKNDEKFACQINSISETNLMLVDNSQTLLKFDNAISNKNSVKSKIFQQKTLLKNLNEKIQSNTKTIVPSKSDTNIFEKKKIRPYYDISDVVSLNNLSTIGIFNSSSCMIDLSKTKILNKISDEKLVFEK